MAKYRFLSDEELKELEEEFKHFLITNGLHTEEWEEMNKNEPNKAIDIVGLFSDLVLEKVYDKTDYLLHIGAKDLKAFKFLKEKVVLLGIEYKGEGTIPLENTLEFIAENASDMLIFSTGKSFTEEIRNKEVHFLVQSGAFVSDSLIFDFLKEIKGRNL